MSKGASSQPLTRLTPDMSILVGGDRIVTVGAELADAFRPGDRLIAVPETGDLLHVTTSAIEAVDRVVTEAEKAFHHLAGIEDSAIEMVFETMARRLEDPAIMAVVHQANADDVASASARQRSTGRLVLSESMLAGMVAGLRGWAAVDSGRGQRLETVHHQGWRVEAYQAPLGVVGFVFEGRPNVIVDAAGVLKSGNTAVLRIGSDALGTARAIMDAIVAPALAEAGVHPGAIGLVDDPTHAGGWALFDDSRLGLAVARGSGPAVAQLGAVARQAGTPVSLHGTGGAWLVVAESADADWVHNIVASSLDRKVCNTLNVCCVVASQAFEMIPRILDGVRRAAPVNGPRPRIHILGAVVDLSGCDVENLEIVEHSESDIDMLAHEWEWDVTPEMTLVVVDDLDAAIAAYNTYSPRFVASVASQDPDDHERFWAEIDAPFVGNGFTRWVDGQYALGRPELGLSNWEHGRLLARGGVLSGDSVYTVRLRAHQDDPMLHR